MPGAGCTQRKTSDVTVRSQSHIETFCPRDPGMRASACLWGPLGRMGGGWGGRAVLSSDILRLYIVVLESAVECNTVHTGGPLHSYPGTHTHTHRYTERILRDPRVSSLFVVRYMLSCAVSFSIFPGRTGSARRSVLRTLPGLLLWYLPSAESSTLGMFCGVKLRAG